MKKIVQSHIAVFALFCSLSVSLSGCLGPIPPIFFLHSASVQVDHDANHTSATPVDLVVIYDEQLLKDIFAMNADKYFSMAKQLRKDNPQKMEVFHWEVVPGQTLNFDQLIYKKSAPVGAIVFARYLTPGEHRKSVGAEEYLVIHLMRDGFETYPAEEIDTKYSEDKESE